MTLEITQEYRRWRVNEVDGTSFAYGGTLKDALLCWVETRDAQITEKEAETKRVATHWHRFECENL